MVAPHCVQLPEGMGPAPIFVQSIAREGSRTPDDDCASANTGTQSRIRANKVRRANLITSPQSGFRRPDAWRGRVRRSSRGCYSQQEGEAYWSVVQRSYG